MQTNKYIPISKPNAPIPPAKPIFNNNNTPNDDKLFSKSPKKDSLTDKSKEIVSSDNTHVPQPPQRNKAKAFVSKIFGVGSKDTNHPPAPPPTLAKPQNIMSPKQTRTPLEISNIDHQLEDSNNDHILKASANIDSTRSATVQDEENQQPNQTNQVLQHLNRDRPKRANVKKPTIKNLQAQTEFETSFEDVNIGLPAVGSKTKLTNIAETASENNQNITNNSNNSSNTKQASPTATNSNNNVSSTPAPSSNINPPSISAIQNKTNVVEQPKIR